MAAEREEEDEEEDYRQVVLTVRRPSGAWHVVRSHPMAQSRPPLPGNEFKCPTCQARVVVGDGGVSSITRNFALLSLRPEEATAVQRSRSEHFCQEHSHEKRVYCHDDRQLVCAYCQLYGAHRGHNCCLATEVTGPAVEALQVQETAVAAQVQGVRHAEEEVQRSLRRLKRSRARSEATLNRHFSSLIHQLECERSSRLDSLNEWASEQQYILNAQLR